MWFRIQVDLATPTAAAANQIGWDDVQVMMATPARTATMGGTTLGPLPPMSLGRVSHRQLERALAQLPSGFDWRGCAAD